LYQKQNRLKINESQNFCVPGLFGFARLIPGDNCEMQLKYGGQKWRCKGKIGNTSQSWEPQSFPLKVVLDDVFSIRVGWQHFEVGQLLFETFRCFL